MPGGSLAARAALARPVDDRLYFAGEAATTSEWVATLAGAFIAGEAAAHAVLKAAHDKRR